MIRSRQATSSYLMYSMRWLVKTWSSKIVSGSPTCITSSPAYADLGGFLRYSSVHSPKISAEFASKEPSDQNNRHEKKPRKQVCKLVLDSFDVQYSKELRHLWSTARDVLLKPQCWQYGVMLNRFSHLTDLEVRLRGLGFYSLLPYADSGLQTQSHPADTQHSLQCLVHKDPVRLPNQKHQPNLLKQYYLLNAASLLPVLALGVREGEKVLDLCSAPGGKALAILQSVTPGMLHCNEVDSHRFEWLRKTLESFVPPTLNDRIRVTNLDGRIIGHSAPGVYDKVLVDAPCSNDRSWLYTPHAQQGELWLRERALLPGLQKELLRSALTAVRVGGEVVYSTCTLSSAENQAVVEEVLDSCPGVKPVELSNALIGSFSNHFTFAEVPSKLGVLVVPDHGRTWGPMFVSRFKRLF